MTTRQQQLLTAITDMWIQHPDWRLGQMIINLTHWARNPRTGDEIGDAVYDVEDNELLTAIQSHLQRRARLDAEDATMGETAAI